MPDPRIHRRFPPGRPTLSGAAAIFAVVFGTLWGPIGALAQEPPKEESPSSRPVASSEDTTELVIHLKDGRQFTGPVVRQDATEVVINVSGVAQRFATEDIDRMDILPPLMDRYLEYRKAVGDDPDQIVHLAEWLQQREKYELALSEVQRALTIDKNHGPSLKLKALLEQQIVLKQKRLQPAPAPGQQLGRPRVAPQRPTNFPLLAKSDVELIKVYETKLEEKPRVLIERNTISAMLQKYDGSPLVPITAEGREAVLRQDPLEILDLMYKLQARDFYPQVTVLDQPKAFVTFRDQVCRTWLINSCSTTMCHGGTQAGRLALYNREPNAERTVYTNFYILSKFRLVDGTPLIDWEQPSRSVLLQIGLPREKSMHPHPVVPLGIAARDVFKPSFRTIDDVQFKGAVDWLKSLYRPRPEYPVKYVPLQPFEQPAAQPPAAQPAQPAPAAPAKPQSGVPGKDPPSGGSSASDPAKQEPRLR